MLALVGRYFEAIGQADTDAELIDLLGNIAGDLGFRSAYLLEYTNAGKSVLHVLDTNSDRAGWWEEYTTTGLRDDADGVMAMLQRGPVQVLDGTRFTESQARLAEFARRVDMVECTLVPVSHGGDLVGVGGFSGVSPLNDARQMAVQLLVYALFAQVRTFRNVGIVTATDSLTPREKEVIGLSADGLTSLEIADRLGMSPRTVNQHVDNVATKLRTRNRAHTVAEAIRHKLL